MFKSERPCLALMLLRVSNCCSIDEKIETLRNIKALDSIVYDDDDGGDRSTLCSLISNQDDDESNCIASYGPDSVFCDHKEDNSVVHTSTLSTFCARKTDNGPDSAFCDHKEDSMVHNSTFSTSYGPLHSNVYSEFHERAMIYANYGKELPMPEFNPDAVTNINHEGTELPPLVLGIDEFYTLCNSSPVPVPKQDSTVYPASTPSAGLSLFPTPAQLAQLQSITIHAPMSRIQNNKYGGSLSELFLAINHHFSYSIPSTEYLHYNPDSFVCICELCSGPLKNHSTLPQPERQHSFVWGHPPVLSISEFNEKFVIKSRTDPAGAENILKQWILRPPHGRHFKPHSAMEVPEFLPNIHRTTQNPKPTKWYPRYQNTSESILAAHTEHQLSYIHRLMDIIGELQDRFLSEHLYNMLSDSFMRTFKVINNITEGSFSSTFTYPMILKQFSEDCKIFTRSKPPYWYKTIFNDTEYEIAILSVVYALDRFEEHCILHDWKRPYKLLKAFQLGTNFEPDPVFKPVLPELNPVDTHLNECGYITSHLPPSPGSNPIENVEISISASRERFKLDSRDGLVTPVHRHLRYSCSNVFETKKKISESSSPTSELGHKLLRITSVDSMAYLLHKLHWQGRDGAKEAWKETLKRREELAALDMSRFYL